MPPWLRFWVRQSGTRCQMNPEVLTVLIVLNSFWKQFFSPATSVTIAFEVPSSEMRYINLPFTYLLTNVTYVDGDGCAVSRSRTTVVSWHWSPRPVTSTDWRHSLTACCACALTSWRHLVNTMPITSQMTSTIARVRLWNLYFEMALAFGSEWSWKQIA